MSNPEYNPASGLPWEVTFGGPMQTTAGLYISFTDHVSGSTFYLPAAQADFSGILAAATIKRSEFRKRATLTLDEVLALFPEAVQSHERRRPLRMGQPHGDNHLSPNHHRHRLARNPTHRPTRDKMRIDINDSAIAGAVQKAVNAQLGAPIHDCIREQAQEIVGSLDLRDVIKAKAALLADGIIHDAVADELRRKVKLELKKQTREGTLL
jgi:hypothetical protein